MQAGRNFDPNTPLADLKVLLGAKMEGRDKIPETVKTSDPLWVDERKIPKNFDARKKWHKKCPRIAEVLDQGRCGSCWVRALSLLFIHTRKFKSFDRLSKIIESSLQAQEP